MHVQADFLVIGGGIAGLRAAADLVTRGTTVLLTKAGPVESNTGYAQGGIAAAIGADDSPDLHYADTLAAGAGLSLPAAASVLAHQGPRYVRELIDWGARFDRDDAGRPALAREGAHRVRRVLHARDETGREIARTLWERVSGSPALQVLHAARATALILDGGRCTGVRFIGAEGRSGAVRARAVLLATGGAGAIFSETTNPPIATGDGVAMAWRAGAVVADLEFVQFHPTVLGVPGAPRFLLSEALRGEGARLVNHTGEPFTTRYHPAGDLAPRDVVAAAMVQEARRTGAPVYLTLAHLDAGAIRRRFPKIAGTCAAAGLDLARDPLPVSPAAHYMCGGVATDLEGRTSVPGLFAAGEVACTGVHGANRLASNSLLEGLVFGARAAGAMREPAGAGRLDGAVDAATLGNGADAPAVELPSSGGAAGDLADVRGMMWRDAGLLRSADGLRRAVAGASAASGALEAIVAAGSEDDETWRRANLALVAALVARAALRREESRGGHRRADFPERDDLHWGFHVAERRSQGAESAR